jgi:hypothetical protein
MKNIFIIAGIISFVFFLSKFIEMKYIDKETRPFKLLIRDTLVVYISVIIGNFISEQIDSLMPSSIKSTVGIGSSSPPEVFVDNPGF